MNSRTPGLSLLLLPLVALSGCPEKKATPPADPGATPATGADPGAGPAASADEVLLRLPMRTDGPKSLDPIKGSTVYDNRACSLVYETLLEYKYLKRPLELQPLLLEEMPQPSADKLTYTFKLKKGIRFHDDPCFPDGKGRELVAKDVFYSWKRIADDDNLPRCWWLLEGTIKGLDAYRQAQNEADTFDYEAPVEGFEIVDDHTFKVTLTEPVYRFTWLLAMFQTSIVPREAVEKYGSTFGRHPVGTGPFTLSEDDWVTGQSMVFHKNPNYRESTYPTEHMPEDEAAGFTAAAGTKLPIADRVEITMFVEDNPMWLQFKAGKLDYSQVPAENFSEYFNKRRRELKPKYAKEGIVSHAVPLLDFIFRGFNMEDELLGGYTEEKKALRRAIALAVDYQEFNDTFYNSQNVVYDGPIPPGLAGHPANGEAPNAPRGPRLDEARELLAKAGYPEGKGLPELEYWVNRGGNSSEQAELLARQIERIGVKLKPQLVDFSQLMDVVNNKKAAFFSFAWGSDYPDGENNLALFYGPNEAPGSNHYNYKRPEYDTLYEQIRSMGPSAERTALYEKMRDMVLEDVPFVGSMARTRYYVVNPWLKNFKPSEDFYNWVKYLDIDPSKRK